MMEMKPYSAYGAVQTELKLRKVSGIDAGDTKTVS